MVNYTISAFVLSLLMNIFIIRAATKYSFFMDPLSSQKIQSFHKNLTPRAGGLSIYLLSLIVSYFTSETMFFASLAFLPSFIYSIYEDIKGNTPQKIRLAVMSVSCLVAILMTGLTVRSIGFFHIPLYLQVPFTIFAVIGVSSALNFIDGLNGLASGVALVTLTFFGLAAFMSNNYEMAATMFLLASLIFGFFICNFPNGKIFLGDAGAYYVGYILAVSSEALVFQNNGISPWFPAAVLGYPIIETLFTIWRRFRRLKNKGIRFFTPERIHFHSLLYLRVFKSNPLASLFLLFGFLLASIPAYLFRSSDLICSLIFLGEVLLYLYGYKNLVNFRIGKLTINLFNFVKTTRRQFSDTTTFPSPKADFLYKSEDKILIGSPDLLEET